MSTDLLNLTGAGFSLPEIAGGTGRIAQIVTSRRTAESTANRIEAIGREDARLRSMQAARLAGAQRASFAARGVQGVSADAIARETTTLEQLDVGRTLAQADMMAKEVRRRGLASALEATLGIAQDYALYGNALKQREQLEATKKATILRASPSVRPGRASIYDDPRNIA